jgi:type III restriction enzyme
LARNALSKARAARTWVKCANQHARDTGGKPWRYVLIPHDAVMENATLDGLAARFALSEIAGDAQSR